MSSGADAFVHRFEPAQAPGALTLLLGAAVELRWQPGGHGIGPGALALAAAWLGKLRAATSIGPLP